ncbi:rhomboid family intramembrane serine protease [Fibrella aquatilis]|uniref:Rhomboid family intramembrane serine protease n=1 Tax=Fibrella aquatilis TaxID=2817059 RepID=A0A939JY52_9BACT|nr:rhomboid family intramembrane serine protease [Fibrella aquatilis]MBO0929993.1 rhomboid family intramembrane serine protease [Fibrella aquatilis]
MSATLLLVIVTVLISIAAWRNESLMDRWIMNPYAVANRGEYYRLVTSGFLHADYGHLFFNMFSFYTFGQALEGVFNALFGDLGGVVFVLFYIAGIIISDIPTLLKYRDQSRYNSLGASGGVSSVIFAMILLAPFMPLQLMFIPIPIPGFIFGLLYLGYSYYASRQGSSGINHDAHLYGALFGLVFMAAVYPAALPAFAEQLSAWRPFSR